MLSIQLIKEKVGDKWDAFVTFLYQAVRATRLFILKFLLTILVVGYVLLIIVPPFFFKETISAFEIRYYVFVFLSFIGVIAFGILRQYNAVYNNTKFIIGLTKQIGQLKAQYQRFETTLKNGIRGNGKRG